MPTLQDVIEDHLSNTGKTLRRLSDETGISYPTLSNIIKNGKIPRKPVHRQRLRSALGMDEKEWGAVLVATSHDIINLPSDGHLTLQQLVSREMYAHDLTEQSLSEKTGLPYPTIMGITRKGSIPRPVSLIVIAKVLNISVRDLEQAIEHSKNSRQDPAECGNLPIADKAPRLNDLVMELVHKRQQTLGAFARDIDVGYLTLARFIESGQMPDDEHFTQAIHDALGLDERVFKAALEKAIAEPVGVELVRFDHMVGPNGTPLQHALAAFMRRHNLTLKDLAKRADLSQVTISRLVKQGQPPTRAITHKKLQRLLELDPADYEEMLTDQPQALTTSHVRADKSRRPTTSAPSIPGFGDDDDDDDDYQPQEPGSTTKAVHDDESIESLVSKLTPKQKRALKGLLKNMT